MEGTSLEQKVALLSTSILIFVATRGILEKAKRHGSRYIQQPDSTRSITASWSAPVISGDLDRDAHGHEQTLDNSKVCHD